MRAVELFWKHLPDLLDQQTDADGPILGINITEFAFAAADIQEILVADVVGGGIRSPDYQPVGIHLFLQRFKMIQ